MSEPGSIDGIEEPNDTEILKKEEFDGRKYRPFEVTVYIDIRNVRGHLMKDCTDKDPPCPSLQMDGLIFEMNKKFQETQMQVILSPLILTTSDTTSRVAKHSHLKNGYLVLSGFQVYNSKDN